MGTCCTTSDVVLDKAREIVHDKDELVAKFMEGGQGHVFSAFHSLKSLEQQNLLNECA